MSAEPAIDDLLAKLVQAESNAVKSITVDKPIDVVVDLGNLLALDTNPIDTNTLRSEKTRGEYLKSVTRDNVQVLFNELWKAPMERLKEVLVVNLPEGITEIPREKPLPKPKQLTKWEAFSRMKGIQKRKRGAKVWDEASQQYKFRWGRDRANDETKQWIHEVPGNSDPYEDQYEKKLGEKKERVAKNELHRLRNLDRATKGQRPAASEFTPSMQPPTTEQLGKHIAVAKSSTASAGVFQKTIRAEKEVKAPRGKKRQFESNTQSLENEKSKQLDILEKIAKKQPKLNTKMAIKKVEEEERATQRVANKTKMGTKMKKRVDPLYSGKKGKILRKAMGEGKKRGKGPRTR